MAALLSVYALIYLASFASGNAQQAPLGTTNLCAHPPYKVHIFSTSPLVIYISDFLSIPERKHLLSVTKNTFSDSAVADQSGTEGLQQTRTSKSTSVPRDPIVDCIISRAIAIQNPALPRSHVEPLQLVSYTQNQSYHFHTDWFTNPGLASARHGGNRISSFFVYVDVTSDITGGGTNFPILNAPYGEEWCEFVDCDAELEEGVTFQPVEGNAVFWMNMVEERGMVVGDERTLHAGLPVTSGGKVGMNIWTREGRLGKEFGGEDWVEEK